MTDQPIRPDYESTTIRITDLAVTDDVIQGKVFSNCQVIGPAVIFPMGCTFNGCKFEVAGNDVRSILLRVPVGPRVGLIAVVGCGFYGVRFTRIGLGVTDQDYDMWTALAASG